MRSAADIDEVGWPESAAELARIESIRSCRPSVSQVSCVLSFIGSSSFGRWRSGDPAAR